MNKSIWMKDVRAESFPSFRGELEVDVAIVGGGICGITSAQLLSGQGLTVAVLEAHEVAASNTGMSTGNLYCMLDIFLEELSSKYDYATVKKVVKSRKESIALIESNIQKYGIECSYKKVPWVRFSAIAEMDDKIRKEYQHAVKLGLDVYWMEARDLENLRGRVGVKISNQAQFNPYAYTYFLAKSILKESCQIFEHSHADKIEHVDERYQLTTSQGILKAKHVIEATHTPLKISHLHTMLGPYREYGVSAPGGKILDQGIFWGYYQKDHLVSVRTHESQGKSHILVIGGPHKVGQGDGIAKIESLKNHGRLYFGVGEFDFEWGGQHYRPADLLPYIGKNANGIYVATGFSTDGLTYGTLAASMFSDLILDRDNPYTELYNPLRVTPVKSAAHFIKENSNVFMMYVKDYMKHDEVHALERNEGVVIKDGGSRMAVCKDHEGEVRMCSAVCPHMGGIVHWNQAESSWDCPLHGSRFDLGGEILEGPAMSGLAGINMLIKGQPIPTRSDSLQAGLS